MLDCLSAEAPCLLQDLLEDSARVYHHSCAVIQSAFHDKWLKKLEEAIAKERIRFPDDYPARLEARVRARMQGCRQSLRKAARALIREQQEQQAKRDRAIRDYVASRAA